MSKLHEPPPVLVADESLTWNASQHIAAALRDYNGSIELLIRAGKRLVDAERRGTKLVTENRPQRRILDHLRGIGLGTVRPQTISFFAGQDILQDLISRLSVEEQDRMAEGEKVLLVKRSPEGIISADMMDPKELTAAQARQVFYNSRVNTRGQQEAYLAELDTKASKPLREGVGPFRFDEELGTFQGRGVVTYEMALEMAAIVREWRKRQR